MLEIKCGRHFFPFFLFFFLLFTPFSMALEPLSLDLIVEDSRQKKQLQKDWNTEVPRLLSRMFRQYFKANGEKWLADEKMFPVLARVLVRIDASRPDLFDHFSDVMRKEFKRFDDFEKMANGEGALKALRGARQQFLLEAVVFFQQVVKGFVPYNLNHGAIADILYAKGWNCYSITLLAEMVVSSEWGAGGLVTVVDILKTDDGKAFPLKDPTGHAPQGILHTVNLIRVDGVFPFFVDQGAVWKHPSFKGINGKQGLLDMELGALADHPEWRGFAVADLVEDFRIKKAIQDIYDENNKLAARSADTYPSYYKDQLRLLQDKLDQWQRSPAALWGINADNIANLNDLLRKNMEVADGEELVKSYNKMIALLKNKIASAESDMKAGDVKPALEKYQDVLKDAQRQKIAWKARITEKRAVLERLNMLNIDDMLKQIEVLIDLALENVQVIQKNPDM